MIFEKSPEISGLMVLTSPDITSPLDPSMVMISPSLNTRLPTLNSLL